MPHLPRMMMAQYRHSLGYHYPMEEFDAEDQEFMQELHDFEASGGPTLLDEIAICRYEQYEAYLTAGFTPPQALWLVAMEDVGVIPPDDY